VPELPGRGAGPWDLANPSYGTTEVPAALILLNYYDIPLDLTNTVHRSDYQVSVGAHYQDGYTGGPGNFTLTRSRVAGAGVATTRWPTDEVPDSLRGCIPGKRIAA
jgi:hypothetical protein